MLNSPLLKKHGVTPAKLVVIGVLGVVFVGVIVWQIPAGKPARGKSTDQAEVAANTNAGEGETKANPVSRVVEPANSLAPWPKLPLAHVAEYDPFRLPPELRQELGRGLDSPQSPQEGPNQQLLSELTTAGAAIVIVRDGQRIARVGANTLRPGDVIAGYRVWKIDAQGVWLVDDKEQ